MPCLKAALSEQLESKKQRIAPVVQRTFYFSSGLRATRITLIETLIIFMWIIFLDGILPIIPTIDCYKLWAQNIHDTFSK